jgi:hypothetical protein
MNTAKSRLATLSNKTVKGAVRRICESLIEMADSIPDQNLSQIAIDKLSAYTSDVAVKTFVSNESRLLSLIDMGIKKSADRIINESSVGKYPHLKGPVAQFRRLSESNPDYLLIENYLNALKPILWEPVVKNEYEVLEGLKQNLNEDILVKTSVDMIKNSRNSFIYGSLIEKLESYIMDRTTGSRKMIIQELDRYKFDTNINKLANNLRLIENSYGGFNMLANTSKCSVKPTIGFVDIKESADYLLIDGSFYIKRGNKVSHISEAQALKESPSLYTVNAISKSKNMKIQEDGVMMFIGKDTVKINENGSIELNGSTLNREELKNKAAVSSIIDPSYSRNLVDVLAIHENIDKMMEIDFSKTIQSNIYEGVKINVIKADSYVVNYQNPSMNENKIVNLSSATQLKNFVWDSLSYDISESFVETLSEENKEINKLKNVASKMFNNIVMIEKELKKIEKEKEEDEDVKESKAVFELERALVEELKELKRRYSKVSKRLNEAMGSVPLPSVGDTVKVRGKGTGTILSVDGVDKKFIVLLNNGETIQCIDKDIDVVESMIKRSDTSSPEADLSIIQGSNARPSGKHGEAKKMMKESFGVSEDVDTLDDVVTISMGDVKGMITDPSNVVKHSEFGATYEEDIENFDEMAEKGNKDYYPEEDEEEGFSMDDDTEVDEMEEEMDETEEMEEEVEEVEEGYGPEDDYRDWDEIDPESDDYYGDDDDDDFYDDEDLDDEDFDDDEEDSSLYGVMTDRYGTPGGYGMEEANDEEKDMEEGEEEVDEDVQSDEMEMEREDESDLHSYEKKSREYPGYGSRQTVLVDPSSDDDYETYGEYDDNIQFEENEENDELLGSYGGAIQED